MPTSIDQPQRFPIVHQDYGTSTNWHSKSALRSLYGEQHGTTLRGRAYMQKKGS